MNNNTKQAQNQFSSNLDNQKPSDNNVLEDPLMSFKLNDNNLLGNESLLLSDG